MKRFFYLYIFVIWLALPMSGQADVMTRVDINLVDDWIREDANNAFSNPEFISMYEEDSRQVLANYARRCSNCRIRLYSCKDDRLFETSMYLMRVKLLYRELEEAAVPNTEAINQMSRDISRYQLLMNTLRSMPPRLDSDSNQVMPIITDSALMVASDSLLQTEKDTLLFALISEISEDTRYYQLTAEEQATRDTCLVIAQDYINHLLYARGVLTNVNTSFAELRDEFASTAAYANERYAVIQQSITHGGQINWAFIISEFPFIVDATIESCRDKYTHTEADFTVNEIWVVLIQMFGMLLLSILIIRLLLHFTAKKPKMLPRTKENPAIFTNALYILLLTICLSLDVFVWHLPLITLNASAFIVYFAYIVMLQTSLLLREHGERASAAMHLYAPVIFYGYVLTFLRFFFVPDMLLILTIFPLSLGCLIWMLVQMGKRWNKVSTIDSSIAAISTIIFLILTIASAIGYTFLSLQLMFWWQAQQAALAIVIGMHYGAKRYMTHIDRRKLTYVEKTTGIHTDVAPEYLIQVTWLDDLIRMVVIPTLGILSFPLCIWTAMGYFNGGDQFVQAFHTTFFSLGTAEDLVFDLSLFNITLSASLYFLFRYFKHVTVAIYTQIKISKERRRLGRHEIDTNEMNLGLGSKVASIIVWGCYIIAVCIIFHLPIQSVTVVLAGMAAGLSFAMQEVLNNFFYGMQLMAGHLRVGDYIICGDDRGYVTSISYQTTQICTETGADVSFTNKDLFSKNFQNLTRQNPYEVSRVYFDVAYGSDIKRVQELAMEEVKKLAQKDKFKRELISMKDVRIEMTELAASGITMAVRFGVLAERMTWFKPVLRNAIYQRLMAEQISIPYNQLDVHIVNPEAAEAEGK